LIALQTDVALAQQECQKSSIGKEITPFVFGTGRQLTVKFFTSTQPLEPY